MSWQRIPTSTDVQHGRPLVLTVDKLGFHVFTGWLIATWTALVACTLLLLERAVHISKERTTIPWHYGTDGLPSLLVTVVAQGHVAVTAMYLTRLALSGLHVPFGTPRSWAEIFWLADAKWSGPVGIIETVFAAMALRIRHVSKAFVLFSIISMAAFFVPLVLESAYPVATVDVTVRDRFAPYTLTESALGRVDAYRQLGSGGGGWATGQSVLSVYNRSTYHPAGQPRGTPSGGDLFFAGDIRGRDMTLPGVRIQGECVNRADIDPASMFPTPGDDTTFNEFCRKEIEGGKVYTGNFSVTPSMAAPVNMSWCSNVDSFWFFERRSEKPATRAFFWYNTSYEAPEGANGQTVIKIRSGITHCAVNTTFGTARLNGRDMSYNSFTQNDTILKEAHGGEPILDPVAAMIYALALSSTRSSNRVDEAIIAGQLGFEEFTGIQTIRFPPTADKFAERMRDGVSHMVASLAALSRTTNTIYDCTTHYAVSGFRRNNPAAISVAALLFVWLAGLLLATAILLRRSFSDGLDSHAAARLLLHRPDLAEGVPMGPADANGRLAEVFRGVHFNRYEGRIDAIEMHDGVGNYAEPHAAKPHE